MTTNDKPPPASPLSPLRRVLKSALIVEDDETLLAALARFCEQRGIKAFLARTQQAAERAVAEMTFDLALVDVKLPDGSGVDVCHRLAEMRPRPVIVAVSGVATGREGFMLARAGVGEYVEKPFTDEELWHAIETNAGVPLEIVVPNLVGNVPLKEAHRALRFEMFEEAVALTQNVSQAAKLLGVTRQAVQQALTTNDAAAPASGAAEGGGGGGGDGNSDEGVAHGVHASGSNGSGSPEE